MSLGLTLSMVGVVPGVGPGLIIFRFLEDCGEGVGGLLELFLVWCADEDAAWDSPAELVAERCPHLDVDDHLGVELRPDPDVAAVWDVCYVRVPYVARVVPHEGLGEAVCAVLLVGGEVRAEVREVLSGGCLERFAAGACDEASIWV